MDELVEGCYAAKDNVLRISNESFSSEGLRLRSRGMEWIKVSERLPEEGSVLCWVLPDATESLGFEAIAYYEGGRWGGSYGYLDTHPDIVTHWMPLPSPPLDKGIENVCSPELANTVIENSDDATLSRPVTIED